MKIALFGGTFNPIHNGHLIIAEMAQSQYKIDKVIFLPSSNPPHKTTNTLVSAKERYSLVSRAIQDNPFFEISSFEMYGKNHYTYQTINHYQRLFPKDEIFYIIGSDSLDEMHSWKKGIKLLDMCTFLVFPRQDKIHITQKAKNKIKLISMKPVGISATMIRKYIAKGRSIRYLVPFNVETYIYAKKLYMHAGR